MPCCRFVRQKRRFQLASRAKKGATPEIGAAPCLTAAGASSPSRRAAATVRRIPRSHVRWRRRISPRRRRWRPSPRRRRRRCPSRRRRRYRPRTQDLRDSMHDRPRDLNAVTRPVVSRLNACRSKDQNGDQQKCLCNLVHILFSYDKIPLRCREKLNFLRV